MARIALALGSLVLIVDGIDLDGSNPLHAADLQDLIGDLDGLVQAAFDTDDSDVAALDLGGNAYEQAVASDAAAFNPGDRYRVVRSNKPSNVGRVGTVVPTRGNPSNVVTLELDATDDHDAKWISFNADDIAAGKIEKVDAPVYV